MALSTLAGKDCYLYNPSSNTIHYLLNETDACCINSLSKQLCSVCDTEQQIKEIALNNGFTEINHCSHCCKK